MSVTRTVAAAGVGLSLCMANGFVIAGKKDNGGLSSSLFAPENFSNSIYLTTQYVFRGVSFSDRDPAIQGSFNYTHPSGFYAGIWGSNWDGFGTETELEIDYYLGLARSQGPVDYDLTALYYTYPGAEDAGFELNYFEGHLGLSHTFDAILLSPTVGAGYNYSPDYSGEDGDGHYVNGTLKLALPADIGLSFGVGHLSVAGGALSGAQGGFSYTDYRVGVSKTLIKDFIFDVTYYGTSNDCQDEYGGPVLLDTEVCTPGAVFTLSRTF